MHVLSLLQSDAYLSALLQMYVDAETESGSDDAKTQGTKLAIEQHLVNLEENNEERMQLKAKVDRLSNIVKLYKSREAAQELEKQKTKLANLDTSISFEDVLQSFTSKPS